MFFKQTLKALPVAAALCVSLLTTTNAQAVEDKMHHGAKCQAVYNTDVTKLGSTVAGTYNASAGYVWVLCPLLRDYGTNNNTLRSYMYIYHNVLGTTYCYLQKINAYGTGLVQTTTSWSGVGPRAITLPNMTSNAGSISSVSMMCYMPPGGFINSIRYYDDAA